MLAIAAIAVYSIHVITNVLQFFQPVLVPIAFAGILAYLLDPIIKRLADGGTPRFRAMMLVWLGFHALLLLLLISVAVPTLTQGVRFVRLNQGSWMQGVGHFVTETVTGVENAVARITGQQTVAEKEEATPSVAVQPKTHTVEIGDDLPKIAAMYSVTPAELEAANVGKTIVPGLVMSLPPATLVPLKNADAKHDPWLHARMREWSIKHGEQIAQKVWGFLGNSFQGAMGMFGYVVGFVLVPLYLYYFLKESAAIKKGWSDYLPLRGSRFKAELVDCLSEINGYLIAFFRGQMLVSLIDGLLVGISLSILGLPYALLIGVFVALLGLIPYVGNIICWFAAILISISHFAKTDAAGELVNSLWGIQDLWIYPLIVTVIFVFVQKINSLVTAPRIVGDAVGLHPLTVIFSVLFWSLLIGGLLGALLAVPLTASLKVIFRRYVWERKVQPRLTGDRRYEMG
jgi:predicted PurR-regulated permease PerM